MIFFSKCWKGFSYELKFLTRFPNLITVYDVLEMRNWSFFIFFSDFYCSDKTRFLRHTCTWQEIHSINISLILFDNRHFQIMCSWKVLHSQTLFCRDNVQVVTVGSARPRPWPWQEHVLEFSCRERNCRNPPDVTQMCHSLVYHQTRPWCILFPCYLLFSGKTSTYNELMHLCLHYE